MSDENIIDWLRSTSGLGASHPALGGYTWRHGEAADEIERLTAKVERLEARGIGGMQRDIRSLRTALRDCMDYFDVDNLTTQTKYEELASVLEETGMKT